MVARKDEQPGDTLQGADPAPQEAQAGTGAEPATCCRLNIILAPEQTPKQASFYPAISVGCRGCRLSIAFQFIDEAPMEKVTEESIAEVLHVSSSRMRHLWKSYLGIGFRQYVIRLRLERARYLICERGMTVKDAAAVIHVRDLSHFYRDFARYFGETPIRMQERLAAAGGAEREPARLPKHKQKRPRWADGTLM